MSAHCFFQPDSRCGCRVTEADVSSGVITAQETTPNGTHLVVAGAMGPFRLTWRHAGSGGWRVRHRAQFARGRPCCHRRAKCAHQRTPHRAKLRRQLRPPARAVAARCAVDPGPGNTERRRKPCLPHFPRAVAARCRSAERRYSPPGCVGGISGQAARTSGYRFGNRTADRFGERLDGGAGWHGSFGRRSPIWRCGLAGCARLASTLGRRATCAAGRPVRSRLVPATAGRHRSVSI